MSKDQSEEIEGSPGEKNIPCQPSRYVFPTKSKSLKDHVRELLKEGKRSHDDEFQVLFRVFGEERIRGLVKGIREEQQKGKV